MENRETDRDLYEALAALEGEWNALPQKRSALLDEGTLDEGRRIALERIERKAAESGRAESMRSECPRVRSWPPLRFAPRLRRKCGVFSLRAARGELPHAAFRTSHFSSPGGVRACRALLRGRQ